MEVLGGNKDAHHCRLLITTWPDICTFQTKLVLCGRLEVMVRLVFIQLRVLTDIIQYVVYHCTLLQLLITVFTSFFQKVQTKRHWNHLVLKMEILIDQNHGMLIPNMFCAFLQIPHHDLVTFFGHIIQTPANNRWFLWLLDRLPTWGTKMYHKDWAMGEDHEKTWDIATQMNIGDKSLASHFFWTKTMNEISLCVLETWLLLTRRGVILGDVC